MPTVVRSNLSVLLLVVAAALSAPAALCAQVTPATAAKPATVGDSTTEFRLRDGSVVHGRVESETEQQVVLVTSAGVRIEVPKSQIVSRRTVAVRASGEVWFDDPNGSRLFFTSTGRSLPKGQGYVANYWLFFPMVAYGVTDRLTLAGGTPIIPELIGEVFYFAPKFTLISQPRMALSVGALAFFAPGTFDEGNAGLLYGVGTFGGRDRAVTLGAGWGYFASTEGSDVSNDPVLMVGGETRVTRGVKLMTENWLSVSSGLDGVYSGGVRFFGERLSADLGLVTAFGAGGCCLPVVNFVWVFGGR